MGQRRGFTLIETLVIIGILTLLTSLLVLYNRTGERQIILLREKARVINMILRAKSLAIQTYIEDRPACGYGAAFDGQKFFIYRDLAASCALSDLVYSGEASGELLKNEVLVLDPSLKFNLEVSDILFVPPDPRVFLNGSRILTEAAIKLVTIDDKSEAAVIINNAGQISSK
jgi:hypothetical protein